MTDVLSASCPGPTTRTPSAWLSCAADSSRRTVQGSLAVSLQTEDFPGREHS